MSKDTIYRQEAIDVVKRLMGDSELSRTVQVGLHILPSAQPDYQEVLGWLLAYHTKSFDLHGRYLPHEVISWLITDFTEEFIADREGEQDE